MPLGMNIIMHAQAVRQRRFESTIDITLYDMSLRTSAIFSCIVEFTMHKEGDTARLACLRTLQEFSVICGEMVHTTV